MDLEVARKALSKRSAFSPKHVAFFVVAGLCLVAGILLRSGQYFAQPEVELNAPVAVAPSPPPVAATPAVEATESVPEHPHPRRTLQPRRPKMWNRPAKQSKRLSRLAMRSEHASSPSPGLGHDPGVEAACRSAGKSVRLCTYHVWLSGWSAVPRDRPRWRLCPYPGLEEQCERLD